MQTEKWVRKSFYVDQIRVTEENMEEVASWCQGEIREDEGASPRKYIHVRVQRALTERQTKAYVGDHVLYAGTSYKVYTHKAFLASFDKVEEDKPVELRNVFDESQNSPVVNE